MCEVSEPSSLCSMSQLLNSRVFKRVHRDRFRLGEPKYLRLRRVNTRDRGSCGRFVVGMKERKGLSWSLEDSPQNSVLENEASLSLLKSPWTQNPISNDPVKVRGTLKSMKKTEYESDIGCNSQ